MSSKPKSDKKLTSYQVAMLIKMLPSSQMIYSFEEQIGESLLSRGLISIEKEIVWIGRLTPEGILVAKAIMGQANRVYRQRFICTSTQ